MTAVVTRSTPGRPAGHTRRAAVAGMIALAATASLVLLDQTPLHPAWLNWSATAVALTTVLVTLMAGLAGWQRMVTAAEDAGVVAPPSESEARNTRP